jgi:predicted PhzF superfamily epimerase YddE/YHI9
VCCRGRGDPDGLERALGVAAGYVGRNRLDYLVEVDSERTVANMRPDMGLLARIGGRGVIVTSLSASAGRDFVSRFFAPASGIDEDPVTGSTHCCLGPFWGTRLGKTELTGYQLSPRGGEVLVRCLDDRVELGGRAVTVLRATLAAAAEAEDR